MGKNTARAVHLYLGTTIDSLIVFLPLAPAIRSAIANDMMVRAFRAATENQCFPAESGRADTARKMNAPPNRDSNAIRNQISLNTRRQSPSSPESSARVLYRVSGKLDAPKANLKTKSSTNDTPIAAIRSPKDLNA